MLKLMRKSKNKNDETSQELQLCEEYVKTITYMVDILEKECVLQIKREELYKETNKLKKIINDNLNAFIYKSIITKTIEYKDNYEVREIYAIILDEISTVVNKLNENIFSNKKAINEFKNNLNKLINNKSLTMDLKKAQSLKEEISEEYDRDDIIDAMKLAIEDIKKLQSDITNTDPCEIDKIKNLIESELLTRYLEDYERTEIWKKKNKENLTGSN